MRREIVHDLAAQSALQPQCRPWPDGFGLAQPVRQDLMEDSMPFQISDSVTMKGLLRIA